FIVPNPASLGENGEEPTETEDDGFVEELESQEEEDSQSPYELLYEEIYSRLFNPQFTIRLG
ncbi:MAG: hypothetical protein KDL87_07505, partial [Verrucomicrobiae bacterium]|nr:hypothetical protein [Verrucomicrobiae bacterium]